MTKYIGIKIFPSILKIDRVCCYVGMQFPVIYSIDIPDKLSSFQKDGHWRF